MVIRNENRSHNGLGICADPIIDLKGLTMIYEDGHKAVDDLNLIVSQGEWYCLLGENGAGKTTTINLILGFLRPTSGQVRIAGKDVQQHPEAARRQLAYVPENVKLYPNLTARQNLEFFTEIGGRRPSRSEYDHILNHVGLKQKAFDQAVKHYSNGMRQKLGVAIALMKGATAMILDEPTSGLDPKDGMDIMQVFENCRKEGVALLMATHDLFRVTQFADRFGIMKSGRLIAEHAGRNISPSELFEYYLERLGATIGVSAHDRR